MTSRPPSMLDRLDAAGRFIENVLLVGLLGGMLLLSVAQILAREVFESGFFFSGEIIRLMVLWLAMVGAVAACRDNRHIRIDAISHLLSERGVAATRLLVDSFAAGVCALIAWHSFRYLQLEREFGDTVLMDTPAWLAHAVVPVAFLLLSYRFLVGVARQSQKLRRKPGRGTA